MCNAKTYEEQYIYNAKTLEEKCKEVEQAASEAANRLQILIEAEYNRLLAAGAYDYLNKKKD